MGLDYGKAGKVPPRDPRFDKQAAPVRSLNEAWLDALDRWAVDTPLSEVIFPLMRTCFFGERCTRCSCWTTVMAINWLRISPASSGKSRARECPRFVAASSARVHTGETMLRKELV